MYRHLDKTYQIDHGFINKDRMKRYKVIDDKDWLQILDHYPIVFRI